MLMSARARLLPTPRGPVLSGCFAALAGSALVACGGSNGGGVPPNPPPLACDSTSVEENGACRTFAERLDERAPTPFTEGGQPVTLEVVLFKPLTAGPYPLIVFHHGSTGRGNDPSRFTLTFTSKAIAQFYVERGWLVAFPQRRGRGQSDGLYDEGFLPDRSAYSCEQNTSLAGAERALADLDVLTDWLRARADVDPTRMVVAGVSRGGALALVHASRRPDVFLGAINYVGGWIGEGCGDHLAINRALFNEAAGNPGPTLWLYGANDSFYSLAYSRANYDSFSANGGMGQFFEFNLGAGQDGHGLIFFPEFWRLDVDNFLGQL